MIGNVHEYPIVKYGLNYQLGYERQAVKTIAAQFARGRQARVEHSSETKCEAIALIPETALDWLKQLICDWQPTLRFGWLVPSLKQVKTKITNNETATYYNVMPLEQNNPHIAGDRLLIYEMNHGETLPTRLDELDWLSAEPPTRRDIEAARDEYHKTRMDPEKAAWLMSWR